MTILTSHRETSTIDRQKPRKRGRLTTPIKRTLKRGAHLELLGGGGLLLSLARGFLGQEDLVNVRENTTGSDGHSGEKFVQLLVVANGELNVSRDDSRLLVVARCVPGKLEDFGAHVLQHSSEIYGSTGTNSRRITTLLQERRKASDWELQASLGASACGLRALLSTTATLRLLLGLSGIGHVIEYRKDMGQTFRVSVKSR
mmetsp:Transcript_41627/g.67523  ORF Transcript_41627/g.67523 Transcript_41627/m.67523 type:complete len:201 (+) Transcript_41627:327-929(+)